MGKFDDITITPEDFGRTASTHTIMTGLQLDQIFKTDEERKAFRDLLEIVDSAAEENIRKAEFIKWAENFAGTGLKILKKTLLPG